CKEQELESAAIFPAGAGGALDVWNRQTKRGLPMQVVRAEAPVRDGKNSVGTVILTAVVPLDVATTTEEIKKNTEQWYQILAKRKDVRRQYIMLMALITLFVLFLAVWIALFLAKQISVPITAVLEAAAQVRM